LTAGSGNKKPLPATKRKYHELFELFGPLDLDRSQEHLILELCAERLSKVMPDPENIRAGEL
jgi:hypothetical protein